MNATIETHNIYLNLNGQQQFRINKINKIKDYFVAEIKEKELTNNRLNKYTASFDYFDKSLIVLSAKSSRISIASFATVIGTPVGIANEKTVKNNTKLKEKVRKNCYVS